jgi:hypothetical protein
VSKKPALVMAMDQMEREAERNQQNTAYRPRKQTKRDLAYWRSVGWRSPDVRKERIRKRNQEISSSGFMSHEGNIDRGAKPAQIWKINIVTE